MTELNATQKKWLVWIERIQAIAQTGLEYGHDRYDLERYTELRELAAEMMQAVTDLPLAKVKDLFCNESGYQTPKIDTRAVVFKDDKILMVHENTGAWSLPGGWCDYDQSIVTNTIKEAKEESGFDVEYERLIGAFDWHKHNRVNHPYGVIKMFSLCKIKGGHFEPNIETTEIGFFGKDELPELAIAKVSRDQIELCFEAKDDPNWRVVVE